jgi:hypothetical protein
MRRGRAGGWVGILVIVGYFVLRFGFIAYRDREAGFSGSAIAINLLVYAVILFVVIEAVLWAYHLHSAGRDRALARMHPGARIVRVVLKRDLAPEIERAAQMLGLRTDRSPRRGYATLVADHNGLGIYVGGSEPRLVLGLTRAYVQNVGVGITSSAGRYGIGKIEAMRVTVSTGVDHGAYWTPIDLPVYKIVVGFVRTLRGEELDRAVHDVASSAGVAVAPTPA